MKSFLSTPPFSASRTALTLLSSAAIVASFAFAAPLPTYAEGADWPQVGGATRDFRPVAPTLSKQWPDSGPKLLWSRDLGSGYSGIAVVGDRLFTAYREGEEEVLIAARIADGTTLWQRRVPAPFAEYHDMQHGTGPNVTPLVVDGRVFFAGIYGDLTAVDGESGAELWKRELIREMGGTELNRGYSTSPLAVGDWLITTIGGAGQGIAAFDRKTGDIVWKSEDFDNGFSSPILIEVDGQRQLVLLGRDGVLGLEPETGRRLWSHPHPTSFGLNISVPVWSPEDHLLFVSAAYNGGSRVLRLSQSGGQTKIEELWAHKQMRIHIGNAIRVGDVVWGANGDFGAVPFTGVHVKTGEVVYRTRDVARTFQVYADGKLILLDEDGVLVLATPTATGLEIHAKHSLFDSKTWTPPTLVGRTLYARDQKRLVALELP